VLQEAQLLAQHATQCGVEAREAIDEIGRFVRTMASPGQAASAQPG
jgi:hypothetical protein